MASLSDSTPSATISAPIRRDVPLPQYFHHGERCFVVLEQRIRRLLGRHATVRHDERTIRRKGNLTLGAHGAERVDAEHTGAAAEDGRLVLAAAERADPMASSESAEVAAVLHSAEVVAEYLT